MGYACPVCDAPQRDETHLANHLALQAIVHGDDHETWLDEHAPEWADLNADSLGPLVSDLAEEREFDEVFEDTVDRTGGHSHGHAHGQEHDHDIPDREPQPFGGAGGSQSLSGDAAQIFEEARSLTREMVADDGGDGDDDPEGASRDDDTDGDRGEATDDDDTDGKES
ncbi:DUF5810 domain-containing protein [Haloferax sulfurifontis]|uniref:Uncharacterized protein n=1 Tax=Haloferax sulfurifontis ATCC BAA-897 TaxID=662480 RepID=M0I1B8_9EURY|nr:DUF5810 domain-containing protein [Haloferax sulfurifontis]ELZ89189.1 hypothetical protein C441_16879 [Haloferax sulfurifontis ATCC BAA-897]